VLFPNTELGHIYLKNGLEAEHYAAERIRETEDLSWKNWGERLNELFQHVEFIFSPDIIIVGGGVSKKYEKYFPYIDIKAQLVPAELRNDAGITSHSRMASSACWEGDPPPSPASRSGGGLDYAAERARQGRRPWTCKRSRIA
jgi:polyphosphate glucokinase